MNSLGAYILGGLLMLPLAIAIILGPKQPDADDFADVERRTKAMEALKRIGGRVR